MGARTTLQQSIEAYTELERLCELGYQAVVERQTGFENYPQALRLQLKYVEKVDTKLSAYLSDKNTDPKIAELLSRRQQLIARILEKSNQNSLSLSSKSRIISDELGKIRKGRGSLPAYKEATQTAGKIIRHRY